MGSSGIDSRQLTYYDGHAHHRYYDDDGGSEYGSGMRLSSSRCFMDDGGDITGARMSRLSICNSKHPMFDDDAHCKPHYESGDADGEPSDKEEGTKAKETASRTSDSETDYGRKPSPGSSGSLDLLRRMLADPLSKPIEVKNYASENEARERNHGWGRRRRGCRTKVRRERLLEKAWELKKCKAMMMMMAGRHDDDDDDDDDDDGLNCHESDHHSMPSTPKSRGGCMYMDIAELRACWDLGFKVEGTSMKEMSSRLSCSTMESSSTCTSPIDNWRISSPGDAPSDVKARLMVWAHAVASTARLHT